MNNRTLRVLIAATTLVLFPATTFALSIGDTYPSKTVRMKNVNEKDITLQSSMKEKGLLVVFSCNHCPYAKAWESRIVALGNEYSKKGIGVVMINPNDPKKYQEDDFETMQDRAKEKNYEFPYVVDSTSNVAKEFGATKTPEAFLFDSSGKLIYHGAIDDNANEPQKVKKTFLKDALEAYLAGKKIEKNKTKAIGCSIKFRS